MSERTAADSSDFVTCQVCARGLSGWHGHFGGGWGCSDEIHGDGCIASQIAKDVIAFGLAIRRFVRRAEVRDLCDELEMARLDTQTATIQARAADTETSLAMASADFRIALGRFDDARKRLAALALEGS
jgi:hypothetical protein